jgi:glycosyltransferase involved in cell wall biosynthesis
MLLAAQAKKHVYCEKPCCHNIREGRAMVDAAKKYGIVCHRAPGGINPELFHPVAVPEAERPAGGEFRVLCYGRIHKRRKGVGCVIRAVEGLTKEFPEIRLVFFDSRL